MKPTSSMYTLHILHGHNIGFQCLIFSLNSLRSLRCCSSWELVPKFLGPDKIGLHITKRSMLNWHSQMGWKGRDIDVKLKNTRWEKPLSIQRLMSTQSIDDMFLNLWSDCSSLFWWKKLFLCFFLSLSLILLCELVYFVPLPWYSVVWWEWGNCNWSCSEVQCFLDLLEPCAPVFSVVFLYCRMLK